MQVVPKSSGQEPDGYQKQINLDLLRLKEIELINSKEEAKQIFTSNFVQDDLQDQLSKYMNEISEGAFDLDFFKTED